MTASGKEAPYTTPCALTTGEVEALVRRYRRGAERAKAAGFDGVEIHGANGYLVDQFLRSGSNRRADRYGGSVEGRARFLLEVAEAAVSVWGAERVGVRLSPLNGFNDMSDADPKETFGYATEALSGLGLAYLHVVEDGHSGEGKPPTKGAGGNVFARVREAFSGPIIANSSYERSSAEAAIQSGYAQLVSFGRAFLANPDLPERFRRGAPLNEPDRASFYGGGAKGYVDYPTLGEIEAEKTGTPLDPTT